MALALVLEVERRQNLGDMRLTLTTGIGPDRHVGVDALAEQLMVDVLHHEVGVPQALLGPGQLGARQA